MKKTLLFFPLAAFVLIASAQASKNLSVMIRATILTKDTVMIDWPKESYTGTFKIYRRTDISQSFAAAGSVAGTANVWKDTLKSGTAREYLVQKVNTSNQAVAEGYLYVGNKAKEVPSFGSVLLLIDSNYRLPLASEITRLKNDLTASGWIVNIAYAGRNEKTTAVKNRILALYNQITPTLRSLYIIGHVPVPYSGYFSTNGPLPPPDGHVEGSGNHTGAWPADLYYGDINGSYTDNAVTCTTGGDTRNHNIPGDGKFDQCKVADGVQLEIGRVDLYNMPTFSKNDTLMVRNYLNKAHDWSQDRIATVERSLIDDNFTSYSLAWTGYLSSTSMIPRDSIFNNRDYFPAQNQAPYLWSFGVGPGSYTTCGGVGQTSSFIPGTFKNIFTSLSGSFFGDWDVQNSFLRAPLAAGSLCSFWGGIPTWYNHHMGMGGPIGFGAQYTQNSKSQDFNSSENSVHIALMGDPTLKVRNVPPAGKMTAATVGGKIKLTWQKATGKFDGYCIYRIDTASNKWTRVNASVITDTFYTDASIWTSGKYKYAVRTIRLETNPSGTWYNLGAGSYAWISYTNSVARFQTMKMEVFPNPSNGNITIQTPGFLNEQCFITVTDIAGRNVFESSEALRNGQVNITLPTGLRGNYFIKCDVNGSSAVNKLILNP